MMHALTRHQDPVVDNTHLGVHSSLAIQVFDIICIIQALSLGGVVLGALG